MDKRKIPKSKELREKISRQTKKAMANPELRYFLSSGFATRKSMKITEEEHRFFEGIQKKYIKQIKKWDI